MTRTTDQLPDTPEGIRRGAAILAAGGLVAFPTETVYGLGVDATSDEAVARLYAAKGRPSFNPLIIHVEDVATAQDYGHFVPEALRLAEAFWPGPLTLVVPVVTPDRLSSLARAGLSTVGLRVPDHPVARDLIRSAGRPVAAPSANRSGHVSPTTAAHVISDLAGRIDAVVDGEPCTVGVESTIVACLGSEPVLLRPGGISRTAIEEILGKSLTAVQVDGIIAPGMTASHYAPATRLRLNATDVRHGEALLAFGPDMPDGAGRLINLSEKGDTIEAAARLFAALRTLDAEGHTAIAVMPIPRHGLGEAISDRLRRAAAPKT